MKFTQKTWKNEQSSTMMLQNQNSYGKRVRITNGKYKGRCATIYSHSLNQDGSFIITLESIPLRITINSDSFIYLSNS